MADYLAETCGQIARFPTCRNWTRRKGWEPRALTLGAATALLACGLGLSEARAQSVTLTASGPTDSTLNLTIANHTSNDGKWFYAYSSPGGGTCSEEQTGTTASVTGLGSKTSYIFKAFSDSACRNELATAASVDTTGSGDVSLGYTKVRGSEADLIIAGRTGNTGDWYYKHTTPAGGACSSVQTESRVTTTRLERNTEYIFKAYSDSTCSTELATAGSFKTLALEVTTDNDKPFIATLKLLNAPYKRKKWYWGRTKTIGAQSPCTLVDNFQREVTISNLNAGQTYSGFWSFTTLGNPHNGVARCWNNSELASSAGFTTPSARFLTLAPSPVPEGGTGEYQLQLSHQPTANVTVNVARLRGDTDLSITSPALTFSTNDWNVAKNVTVSAAADDDAVQGSATFVHYGSTLGGYVNVRGEVMATEQENGVVLTTAALSLSEGATASYGVSLPTRPSSDVTVILTAPSTGDPIVKLSSATQTTPASTLTLSFTGGGTGNWNTLQMVTVTAPQDYRVPADTAPTTMITHVASGGMTSTVELGVAVTNIDTSAFVVSTTELRVSEAGSANYTLKLAGNPGKDVAVNVSLDTGFDDSIQLSTAEDGTKTTSVTLNFTAITWNTAQAIWVFAASDDDNIDGTANIVHSAREYTSDDITVQVTEQENRLVLTTAALSLSEGATVSYGVSLPSEPASAVTVTLTAPSTDPIVKLSSATQTTPSSTLTLSFTGGPTGNWNTPQSVTVTAPQDYRIPADAAPATTSIAHTASVNTISSVDLGVAVTNSDAAALVVSTTALRVPEAGSSNYTLKLASIPDSNLTVNVNLAAGFDDSIQLSTAVDGTKTTSVTLNFTPDTWNNARTIWVFAANDDDTIDGTASIVHTARAYVDGAITSQVAEDDAAKAVTVAPTEFNLPVSTSTSYSVSLSIQPAGDVIVTPTSSDITKATVSTATDNKLTFTTSTWNTAQMVTVSGVAAGSATVMHTISGYGNVSVSDVAVTITTPAVTVRPTVLNLGESTSTSYSVSLSVQPVGDVIVTPTSSDITKAKVSTATDNKLTFTTSTWNTAQMVTVTGVAVGEAAVSHMISGGGYDSAIVSNVAVAVTSVTLIATNIRQKRVTLNIAGHTGNWYFKHTTPTGGQCSSVQTGSSVTIGNRFTGLTGNTTYVFKAYSDSACQNELAIATEFKTLDLKVSNLTPTTTTLTLKGDYVGTWYFTDRTSGVGSDRPCEAVSARSKVLTGLAPGSINIYQAFKSGRDIDRGRTHPDGRSDRHFACLVSDDNVLVTTGEVKTPIPDITLSTTSLNVTEDSTAYYTVHLDPEYKPLDNVVVSVARNDGDEDLSVSPSTLTFSTTNWSNAQSVTVSATGDADGAEGMARFNHTATGANYRNSTATLTATERETGLVLTTGSLSVSEGGTAVYGISLASAPSADIDMSVAVPSDSSHQVIGLSTTGVQTPVSSIMLTFTTENWGTVQSVTVTVTADDVDNPADVSIDVTHTPVVDGNNRIFSPISLPLTVVDDDVARLVFSTSDLTVTELTRETYPLKLGSQPAGNVVVTVSRASGDESIELSATSDPTFSSRLLLTFGTDSWNTAQTITVTAKDDADEANGSAVIVHQARNYASGAVNKTIVASDSSTDRFAFVLPDPPLGTVADMAVTEGGTETYTIALKFKPGGPVTVMVAPDSNNSEVNLTVPENLSLTFGTGDWNNPREVVVTAAQDDDGANGTALFTHTPSGDYYGTTPTSLTISEIDDDAAISLSVSSLNVSEGTSMNYGVKLAKAPGGSVVVTIARSPSGDTDLVAEPATLSFHATDWNSYKSVTVTAGLDSDTDDGVAAFRHSVDRSSYNAPPTSLTVTENDGAPPPTLSTNSLTVSEGGNASYTVVLPRQPTGPVTITIEKLNAVTNDDDLTLSTTSLAFDASTWNTPQIVTVTAAADDVDVADGTALFEHKATGGGYGGAAATLTVTEDDDDAALAFSVTELTVTEGMTATYGVQLVTKPTASVTLDVAPSDPSAEIDVTVTDGASLTFTTDNWNTDQQVELTAGEDVDSANGTEAIIHDASNGGYGGVVKTLTVTEADNDPLGFVFAQSDGTALSSLSVPESGTAVYQVKLASQPSASTAVTVQAFGGSTDDSDLSVVGPFVQGQVELVFLVTNWNNYQMVTLNAAPDDDAADGTARIRHRASGTGSDYNGVSTNLTATEIDDDEAALTLSVSTLTVTEEGSAGYTVKLATRPTGSVTVAVANASGDRDLTVTSGASLTFTTVNWNSVQSVSLSAGDDDDYDDGTAVFTHTASGGDYGEVVSTLTVTEDDTDIRPDFVFDPASVKTSLTVPEGGTATYRVKLTAEPSGDTWVGIGRTGGDSDLVASPAELAFTTGNWNDWKTVTLTAKEDDDVAAGTAVILHLGDEANYDGVEFRLHVTEADNDAALVLSPSALTVTEAGSASFGVKLAAKPTGSVTVKTARASGDTDITITTGASLTFTTGDWNTAQSVTLSAAADEDASAGTAEFTLTASGGDYDTVVATLTATESDTTPRGYIFVPASVTESLTVSEGGSVAYGVRLNSKPSGTVWLDVGRPFTGGGDTDLNADPTVTTLTFTTDNWSTVQSVTLTATDDADAAAGVTTILHRGDEADFDGIEYRLSVTEADDDAALVLSTSSLTVTEAGSASFNVQLAAKPGGSVTVAVARKDGDDQDSDLSVKAGTSLTFTTGDWNTAQPVTLSAAEDMDTRNDTAVFSLKATGGDYGGVSATLTATESDTSPPGFVFDPSSVATLLEVSEGGTATYGVSLNINPGGTVQVKITKATAGQQDPDLNLSGGASLTLTFNETNWNSNQFVTLTAREDSDALNGTAMFTHTDEGEYFRGVTAALTATEQDNDLLVFSRSTLLVPENGIGSYGLKLAKQPSSAVKVTVKRLSTGSQDTDLGLYDSTSQTKTIGTRTFTFSASDWNSYQSVTLFAAEDDDSGDGTAAFDHKATGAEYDDVTATFTATEQDNTERGFLFDYVPLSDFVNVLPVQEGSTASYGVRLASKPSGPTTVTVSADSRDDPDIKVKGPGGSTEVKLTFSASDWNVFQSVTVTAEPDTDAISGTTGISHLASAEDTSSDYHANSVLGVIYVGEVEVEGVISQRAARKILSQSAMAAMSHVEWALERRFSDGPWSGIGGRLAGGSLRAAPPDGDSGTLLDGLPASAKGKLVRPEPKSGTLSFDDVLAGGEFMIGRETDDGRFGALWVQGAVSGFSSGGGATVDGDARSITIGADYRRGNMLAGLALSRIGTEGSYNDGVYTGVYELRMTGLYPYFKYWPSPDLSVWGTVGYGTGKFDFTPTSRATVTTDLKMIQAMVGVRQLMFSRADRDSFELALTGSFRWYRIKTDAVPKLDALSVSATRLRFGLEAFWPMQGADGSVWTPRIAIHARHDNDEEEGGFGLEGDVGFDWSSPDGRMTANLTGRALLAHSIEHRREWSVSAQFTYDPFPDSDYGFSAKLSPNWGGQHSRSGRAISGAEGQSGTSLSQSSGSNAVEGELRYGFPQLGGRATGSLSTQGVVGDGNRRLGIGYRFDLVSRAHYAFGMEFRANAEHRQGRFRVQGGQVDWSLSW